MNFSFRKAVIGATSAAAMLAPNVSTVTGVAGLAAASVVASSTYAEAAENCVKTGRNAAGGNHYVCQNDPVKGGLKYNDGHPDTAEIISSEYCGGSHAFAVSGSNRTEVNINARLPGGVKPGRNREYKCG
jgi:hypothetical protein